MVKAIIKGVYSKRVIDEKELPTFEDLSEYVFTKYNAVYDIEDGNQDEYIFEVYQD